MDHFRRIISYWLPLAVVASGLCVFIYAAVQQNYRMGANDPQIEMAQTAAAELTAGKSTSDVIPANPVDLASSLSPFMIIYDEKGNVVSSSAVLEGRTPDLPKGVLTAASKNGENRVTWQPEPGVRIAAVVDAYRSANGSGYVLAGRSLKEVEARIDNLTLMLGITWAAAMLSSLVLIILFEYFLLHPKEKS